ncbi:MAG: HAMP domain-containing histidine kinase [Bacteroidaceae bacterium]|nr:HAMP domain-containing histidine kinase [Bacteroidaceae bacterium]
MEYELWPPILILLLLLLSWLYSRHQRSLRHRAWLMNEAVHNRDFSFRLSSRGLTSGERAMQEMLNNMGQEISRLVSENEVESWQRLTRVLTHEVMNGMAPITSISQSLLHRPEVVGSNLEEGLRAIHDTGRSLSAFVESYRKMSQLEAPRPSKFGLLDLTRSLIPSWPEMRWETDIPKELIIMTDENMLRQVLTNLLRNAEEAGANSIDMRWKGRTLMVSNNGEPIPAEAQPDIFVPFFTTKTTGTGIGLSLSRQMMVSQGGDLLLAPQPTAGYHVTFLIQFPAEYGVRAERIMHSTF